MEVLRLHVSFNTIQFKNHGDALQSKPFDSNKSVSYVYNAFSYTMLFPEIS